MVIVPWNVAMGHRVTTATAIATFLWFRAKTCVSTQRKILRTAAFVTRFVGVDKPASMESANKSRRFVGENREPFVDARGSQGMSR